MAAYLAAMKQRQEQFTQVVRELASLPANRHCFDCGQRGPTYVNMTIGSYVCTTCSGLLRGLNPPHRIKSIAMASFVAEEIDFLKATGNELCQQAYFAMFDGRFTIPESSSVNPQAVRDFLTLKYEKRLWFSTPSAHQHNEARRKQSEALERMRNEQSGVRMRSASASQAPRPIARPNSQTDAPKGSASVARPNSSAYAALGRAPTQIPQNWNRVSSAPKLANAVPTLINAANKLAQANAQAKMRSNLLPDPFSPTPATAPASNNPFAHALVGANNGFSSQPANPIQPQSTEKYAALAELDALFKNNVAQNQPVATSSYDPFQLPFNSTNSNAPLTVNTQFQSTNLFNQQQTTARYSNNPFLTPASPVSANALLSPSNPFAPAHNTFNTPASPQPTLLASPSPFPNNNVMWPAPAQSSSWNAFNYSATPQSPVYAFSPTTNNSTAHNPFL